MQADRVEYGTAHNRRLKRERNNEAQYRKLRLYIGKFYNIPTVPTKK